MKLVILILLSSAFSARAVTNPCNDVVRKMPKAEREIFASLIAKTYKVKKVDIAQVFLVKEWSIIEVAGTQGDDPYVFLSGKAPSAKYIKAWSGAAAIFEEKEIYKWTKDNVPGIPDNLAKCFSWHVTQDRNNPINPE